MPPPDASDTVAPYGDEVTPPDFELCRELLDTIFDAADQLEAAAGNSAALDFVRHEARILRSKTDVLHTYLTDYEERHHE